MTNRSPIPKGMYYILEADGTTREVQTYEDLGRAWADETRIIGKDVIEIPGGQVEVSTVFLVIDHNYMLTGRPVLFETMIFGGDYNDWQRRYYTLDEARDGHVMACAMVNGLAADNQDWR